MQRQVSEVRSLQPPSAKRRCLNAVLAVLKPPWSGLPAASRAAAEELGWGYSTRGSASALSDRCAATQIRVCAAIVLPEPSVPCERLGRNPGRSISPSVSARGARAPRSAPPARARCRRVGAVALSSATATWATGCGKAASRPGPPRSGRPDADGPSDGGRDEPDGRRAPAELSCVAGVEHRRAERASPPGGATPG